MKIKITDKTYDEVMAMPPAPHKTPGRQWPIFRLLLRILSVAALKKAHFTCRRIGMEKLGRREPCLVLMNHSCFIDLKITSKLLAKRPYHIVCTSDGFVGKELLMRLLGCIPTRKFQNDLQLVRDMKHVLHGLKSSVLLFPEASYSFDGTATPLPRALGKLLKHLDVPVVMIRTYGAFARDPLYNNLQLRRVDVSADMEYILSPDDIREKSVDELNAILEHHFTFDSFRWQQENNIRISEPFRADHLDRVLYKCPHCGVEGKMLGKGETITCTACSKTYRLTELGFLEALGGETKFSHVPDWYRWQREEVRRELLSGEYRMEVPVGIGMLVDMKSIYRVGEGVLTHTQDGFRLVGCDGKLDVTQKPTASYSLYSDFYWYEVSDIICIGSGSTLYYCFLPDGTPLAAKARIAAEELYKLALEKRTARA